MSDFSNKKEDAFVSSEEDVNKENYSDLIEELMERNLNAHKPELREKRISFKDTIAEKEKIRNIGRRQDIDLKKKTLNFLHKLLFCETAIIFLFSFFQATKFPMDFHLEEWSFKLLVTATISQITIMLLIAVKHLFPDQK